MVLTFVVLVTTLLGTAMCDYSCLCNYNVELGVTKGDHSSFIGYLYEFDCKPVIQYQTTSNYTAIAYEHQVGYVHTNNDIQIQMCPGDPSIDDIVTTKVTTNQQTTTTQATTMQQTTTEKPTTMQPTTTTHSTTMQSTTRQATTMQPTTTQQKTTTQATTIKSTTTTKPTTMQPKTTTQSTTMLPTTTTKATTMQQTTTKKATTMQQTTTQPTTTRKATTMQPTTTQPTTTRKATTMQPTTTQPTTTKKSTTMQPTTKNVSTMKPTTAKPTAVCPQIVLEHARGDNNIIATLGHACYEVMANHRTSWNRAETDCKSRAGHLLDIGSAEEQTFINVLLSENSFKYDLWIGLNDRNHEEHFEWVSGNANTFMNWFPGRKNTYFHDTEDCVYMSASNKWQWEDARCDGILATGHNFVCQYHTAVDVIVG